MHVALASGTARAVLCANVRTGFGGNTVDEFGAGTHFTAEAFVKGTFVVGDLVGLDATAAGHLGKMRTGAWNTAGSLIELL